MMCFSVNVFISRLNMGVYGPTHFWSLPQEAIRGTTVFGITALASALEQVATCSLLMHYFVSYALSFTTYTQRGAHEMKVNWHNGPWQQIITGQCRSIINSSKGGWLQYQVGLVTLLLRFRSSLAKRETPVTSYFTASNALCKTLEPVQCGKCSMINTLL